MEARLATRISPRTASDPTVNLRLSVRLSHGISASPSSAMVSTLADARFIVPHTIGSKGRLHRPERATPRVSGPAGGLGPFSVRGGRRGHGPALFAASLYFAHEGGRVCSLSTAGMKTLYRATRIYTLGHPSVGEWLLVDGRHVERVGVGDPPLADREVDLAGTTITPGFIDTHVHLTGTTLSAIGIPLERARSGQELLGLVAEELTHGPTKVLAHGFDESRWDRPDLPVATELDELGDVPIILIRADGHIALANTAALDRSGAAQEEGVDTDAEGRPTGTVRKAANRRLQRWFHQALSDHELRELQLQAAATAASRGVTCVHEMAVPPSHGRREVEVLLEHRHQLP